MGCLAPLVFLIALPSTQSWSSPEVVVHVRETSNSSVPTFAFVVDMDQPHLFVRLRSNQSDGVWYSQTDLTGTARLTIPKDKDGLLDSADATVDAWSLTGRRTLLRIGDENWINEE